MDDDVLRLTQAAADGDRVAVDALLQHFLPDVRAFVRLRAGPLLRARESNSDLVQSICREVLEHMDGFRYPSETAFRQWLFSTALRKIQHRREYYLAERRDPGREVPMQGAGSRTGIQGMLLDRYRSFSSPSGNASMKEEVERIEAAFDHLTEVQREVVTLAHLVGLTRAEIGERLGKSEGAVRVILFRALARLSGLLQPGGGA